MWCEEGVGCHELVANCALHGGFHFAFRQLSDGVNFEVISPYIDGIQVDEREMFELRFVVASEALGDTLGTDSPYFSETEYDEGELWQIKLERYQTSYKKFLEENPCFLGIDSKQCTCDNGRHCNCGAQLQLETNN